MKPRFSQILAQSRFFWPPCMPDFRAVLSRSDNVGVTRQSEITRPLHLEAGDREALGSVAWLTYDDLHAAAIRYLRCEYLGQPLQAAGLVNELCLPFHSSSESN
jgi:hypothetical protein